MDREWWREMVCIHPQSSLYSPPCHSEAGETDQHHIHIWGWNLGHWQMSVNFSLQAKSSPSPVFCGGSFVFFNCYRTLAALQCCVSYYCKAKWIIILTHISPLFWISFLFRTPQGIECTFSLAAYFIYRINSVYVLIPISHPTHPSFHPWYPYI